MSYMKMKVLTKANELSIKYYSFSNHLKFKVKYHGYNYCDCDIISIISIDIYISLYTIYPLITSPPSSSSSSSSSESSPSLSSLLSPFSSS